MDGIRGERLGYLQLYFIVYMFKVSTLKKKVSRMTKTPLLCFRVPFLQIKSKWEYFKN